MATGSSNEIKKNIGWDNLLRGKSAKDLRNVMELTKRIREPFANKKSNIRSNRRSTIEIP